MLARGPGARLLGTAALRRGLAVAGTAIGGLAATIGSAVLGRAAGAVVQGGAVLERLRRGGTALGPLRGGRSVVVLFVALGLAIVGLVL